MGCPRDMSVCRGELRNETGLSDFYVPLNSESLLTLRPVPSQYNI